jgi:hypothetical protein
MNSFRRLALVVVVATATIASGLLVTGNPATAAPGIPTLSAPSSAPVPRNTATPITNLVLTDNSTPNVQVQVASTNGTLTMSTTTGLTFTTGDGTADAELQFNGAAADVQDALDSLSYTPTNNYLGGATITFKTSPGGGLFNPDNGHFYQFVETGVDTGWTQAKADAQAMSYGGMSGYLATVTSASEQAFVSSKLNGEGWFGASDNPTQTGSTESRWFWVTGPEAGTEFWHGTYNGAPCSAGPCLPVSGRYNNWSGGEPNNCCGAEDYVHFLNSGAWNDYPETAGIEKYLVEFGGQVGDVSPLDTDVVNLTVSPTAPTAPTSPSLTRGNAQITVNWSAPSDNGGAAIDNYLVEYRPVGGNWSTFGTPSASPVIITNLQNGQAYDVRVSAHNSVGYGPVVSAGTATPITTATAPTSLAASVTGGQTEVSWSAPASNGGSAITGYKVEHSTDGTTWTQSSASTSSPHTITGLTNGTAYQVRVTPLNGAGAGTASTTSVTPGVVPTSPQNVAAATGRNSSDVTWTAPVDNGGYAITGYKIEYSTDGGSTWTTAVASTQSPYTLTGLTNGTAYQVRVSAINAIGTSGSSTANVTPQGVPDPPVDLAVAAGTSQAVVTWNAPAETGGLPITGYKVEYRTANSVWQTLPASTTSPAALTGLTPGTTYDVRVAAVNALGESTTVSSSVTTAVPPSTGTSVPVFVNPTTGEVQTVPTASTSGNFPPTAIASTPTGQGSWTVTPDGGVFTAGDAGFFGSMGGVQLVSPAVNIAGTPSGEGYLVVAADGGVFAFGDAQFQGSMGGKPLNSPVKSIGTTCANNGYYLVAGDGGVFAFGQAGFFGSMGGKPLNKEMQGIVDACGKNGYWTWAADGGVFTFGDAQFFGSLGSNPPAGGVVGMVSAPDGLGYWLIGADKKAYGFGSAA